jgi:hypothetical protein
VIGFDSSIKERDFSKAKQVACEKYKRMVWLQENDEIDVTRKPKDLTTLTKRQLQTELDAETGKSVYKHYIQAIDNYLIISNIFCERETDSSRSA